MEEDSECPLLLGRPFLAIGITMIDMEVGEVMLRIKDEKKRFNVFDTITKQGRA